MTPNNKKWIEKRLKMVNPECVLEIGSQDINGSIERIGKYTGIDMQQGPGVDIVANAHLLPFIDGTFNCIICSDMLEHDDDPFKTSEEIWRVLANKGVCILTVPGVGFKRHDFPSDYWRFTTEAIKVLFKRFTVHELVEDSVEFAVRAVLEKQSELPSADSDLQGRGQGTDASEGTRSDDIRVHDVLERNESVRRPENRSETSRD